jgi:hypothetical protein
MDKETLCSGSHNDTGKVTARAPYRLCAPCTGRLRANLGKLPALFDDCERALITAGHTGGDKITHRKDPGLVLSLPAFKARTAIRSELVSWVRIVMEERQLTDWPDDLVGHMAPWLQEHADWMSQQPWAGEVSRTIADTVREARAAAYPNPVRRITIGPCPLPDCTGELTALLRDDADLLPSVIRCQVQASIDDTGAHVWAASEWMNLGRMLMRVGYGEAITKALS